MPTESALFVKPGSIVRKIWGDADVILLIFAGSAAEFALNKEVDWLFFTGKLPADPIGRLFSTVRYAQEIVFQDECKARQVVGRMHAIHGGVEQSRGRSIPAHAYRDVLYMLIDYSMRAFELLHRPLTEAEKNELFTVFRRVGAGMHLAELPDTLADWRADRQRHLDANLERSPYTDRLFARYRDELGSWRYDLLLRAQSLLVPERVRTLLGLPKAPVLASALWLYGLLNALRLRRVVQRMLLPPKYLRQVQALDR